MTPEEWDSCTDPQQMLEFLTEGTPECLRGGVQTGFYRTVPHSTDRKLTLFAVACCQQAPTVLESPVAQEVVKRAALYADGETSHEEVVRAVVKAYRAAKGLRGFEDSNALYTAKDVALQVCWEVARNAATGGMPYDVAITMQRILQSNALRDIFGHRPFRRITIDSFLLTLTVVSLAQAIYAERAFDRMPILADALEESGCTDASVLEHCRSSGEHVRGCWVVDLVLGKEGS